VLINALNKEVIGALADPEFFGRNRQGSAQTRAVASFRIASMRISEQVWARVFI